MAGLAGTALGDLFVFGDLRDAVREGSRYISGENYDQLILGLSVVGIAITAGTYATVGAAAPARVGISAVKAARKAGRISGRMADWIGRSLRDVVAPCERGRRGLELVRMGRGERSLGLAPGAAGGADRRLCGVLIRGGHDLARLAHTLGHVRSSIRSSSGR